MSEHVFYNATYTAHGSKIRQHALGCGWVKVEAWGDDDLTLTGVKRWLIRAVHSVPSMAEIGETIAELGGLWGTFSCECEILETSCDVSGEPI